MALLRTRGGISRAPIRWTIYCRSSPHTRRYFQRAPGRRRAMALFSAHAEVFPLFLMVRLDASSLLRTRGGISAGATVLNSSEPSSPHTRRYFLSCLVLWVTPILFSAHAEVFPLHGFTRWRKQPLLRTRGGISFT